VCCTPAPETMSSCPFPLSGAGTSAGLLGLLVTLAFLPAVGGAGQAWYPETANAWATSVDGAHRICLDGKQQSPIDFPACPAAAIRPAVSVTWADQSVELLNNGHTVQLTPQNVVGTSAGQMTINIAGETKLYNLLQCHFHWGSEHTWAGQQQVLELHCVHQESSHGNVPRYGVLGIFFELGAANSFLARFEDALPTHTVALAGRRLAEPQSGADLFGNPVVDDENMDARRLAGANNVSSFTGPIDFKEVLTGLDLTRYWNYDGSFTTPPCTEAVDWYVLMSRATVSQAQLDKFRSAMGWQQAGGNFRSAQPLSGRTVYGCDVLPAAHTDYPWYPYNAQHWATDAHGANSVCQHGTFQSPINFAQCVVPVSRTAAEITWAKQPVTLVNNGHAVQITAANTGASRGKMVVDRKSYTLVQCHWHWSSEHMVGQRQYPLEVHCVHQLDGTDEAPLYGVFGFFYELSDSPNPFLSQFEDQLPDHNRRLGARPADGFDLFGHPMEKDSGRRMAAASTVSTFKGPLDFKELYNGVDLGHYWNYEGSFTTPPCTEAVTFYIMMDAAPISQSQLDKFKTAIGWEGAAGNFRPPQPLHGRTVSGCRAVATPVIAATGPFKARKCVDQTRSIVMQSVITCVVAILLAAVLVAAWQGIFSPSGTSVRQVQPKGLEGGMLALQEDMKVLEMHIIRMQERSTISKSELTQVTELVQQIDELVKSSQSNASSSFLQDSNFMKAHEEARRSASASSSASASKVQLPSLVHQMI